jgi:hypothetical protein
MSITISDTEPRVQYTATAGQTSFTVGFEFFDVTDLKVFNGTTLLSYNVSPSSASQYSVAGAGVSGGGSITLGGGASLNDKITIFRDIAIARSTDFPISGAFQIESLNVELDKIVAMTQQLERDFKLTPKAAPTTSNTYNITFPNLIAGKVLSVNSAGDGLEFVQDASTLADITGVAAGTGLTGGGTSGDVTLNVIGGTGITANANDIAIDSTVATLTGTQTLSAKTLTSPVINTGVSGSAFLDEDNMASDSDTKIASQQSIKAYVDAQVATVPVGDITSVVAGTGLSGGATSGAATLNIDSTVATLTGSQILTNKTIDVDNNTVSNIEVDNLKSGVLDTALASVSSNDDTLASAKAIKAYVDTQVATVPTGDITSVVAGTGLSGGATSGAATLNIEAAQPTITSLGTITGFTSTGIDDNATSTAITIDSSERVGIGTTSPAQKLTLASEGRLRLYRSDNTRFSDIYNNTSFLNIETSHDPIKLDGQSYTRFDINSSEQMRLNSTGLGIGTSNPSEQIEISGTGTQTLKIDRTDASSSGAITINSANNSNYIYNLTSKNLILGTDNNARLTVDGTGNVGINTISPDHLLHISASSSNAQLKLQRTGSATASYNISASSDALAFSDQVAGSERMRITSTGLGIGTSSPSQRLHVYSTGNDIARIETNQTEGRLSLKDATGDAILKFRNDYRFTNSTGELARLNSSGNFGIGTTAPDGKLHLDDGATTKLIIEKDNGGAGSLIFHNDGSQISYIQLDASENMVHYGGSGVEQHFYSGGSERMRIFSAGNVSVGTTQDQAKLQVTKSSSGVTVNSFADDLFVESSGHTGITIGSGSSHHSSIYFANSSDNDIARIAVDHSDGSMRFNNNASERMRINANGQLLIGTTDAPSNTDTKLRVHVPISSSSKTAFELSHNTTGANKPGASLGLVVDNGGASTNAAQLTFGTASGGSVSERMRIDSSGRLLFSKTTDDNSVQGVKLTGGQIIGTVANDDIMILNRTGNDGKILRFFQDTTEEGNVSVSGSTVSYNGFTGTHWSRFTDNSTPTILRGTVLESLDEMCDWYNLEFDVITQDDDGNDVTISKKIPHVLLDSQSDGDVITYNHEGTDYQATIVKEGDVKHMMSKVSDTVDAKNVYGLFVAYDLDGEGYNDFYVASVGSYVVRIKQGETIAKGDLLQSNGDGTAKVQTDDNVKSSSFAKVLSTTIIETYEDGSYLVPCSLNC